MVVNLMIITAGLACLNGPLTARGLDLRPTFVSGQVIRYHSGSTIEHRGGLVAGTGLPTEPVKLQTEALMSLRIARVDPVEGTEVLWTLERFAIRSTAPIPGIPDSLDYDSGTPGVSASPLASLFEPLINHPMTVRIDPHGRVVEVTGRPQFDASGPLGPLAEGYFSKQMFQQLPFFVTANAPRPARRRSSWDEQAAIPLGFGLGHIELRNRYRIDKISSRRKTADISMTGTLQAPTGTTASALQVHEAEYTGQVIWDTAHSQLSSATSLMTIRATVQSLLGPMHIDQRIDSWVERVPATPEEPGKND